MLDRQAVMARVEAVRRAAYENGRPINKGDFAASLGMLPTNYSKCLRGEAFLTPDQIYSI